MTWIRWFPAFPVLLFVATTSSAETAWVLWTNTQITTLHRSKPPDFTTTWMVDEAFDTHAQCDLKKEQVWQRAVDLMVNCKECTGIEKMTKVPFESLEISFKPTGDTVGGSWNQLFRCYPDSIDPRKK